MEADANNEFIIIIQNLILFQGQLTVKGSSKRMIPRFQEPILG